MSTGLFHPPPKQCCEEGKLLWECSVFAVSTSEGRGRIISPSQIQDHLELQNVALLEIGSLQM